MARLTNNGRHRTGLCLLPDGGKCLSGLLFSFLYAISLLSYFSGAVGH
ncbi:hypothetical protein KCP74_12700 [Salmonella enterica subsp. enterica]|nr:hypothetical protein KCP74_12700 [Salmonella enterica subsp. enterica]